MKTLGIAGYSGSGKTTLLTRLIPELRRRGLSVSTIKHTHHAVLVDRECGFSRALRDAGALEVALVASQRWFLLHELRDAPEYSVEDLAALMSPVDLLLIEGFKAHSHDKIEVHRPAAGKPLLCPEDPHIIAVATDAPLPDVTLPLLDLNDVLGIADFVLQRYRFEA